MGLIQDELRHDSSPVIVQAVKSGGYDVMRTEY
jgi:hypothetical protein